MSGVSAAVLRIAVGRAIAGIGFGASFVALTYHTYEVTRSTLWVSAVSLVSMAALGVLTPIGGHLADRVDRRQLMIASLAISAAMYAAMTVATGSIPLLVALALLATAVWAVYPPAARAAFPNITPTASVGRANGLLAAGDALQWGAGPLVTAVLYERAGLRVVFLVGALGALLAAAITATAHGNFRAEPTSRRDPGGLRDGFRFLRTEPILRAVLIADVVAWAGVGFPIVSDVPMANLFGVGSTGYALMIVAWGAGMLIGSWIGGRRHSGTAIVPVLVAVLAMMAVAVAAAGLAPTFWLFLALSVAGGAGSGAANVLRVTLLQDRTPDVVRGRVFGANDAIAYTSFAASLALAGVLAGAVGPRASYVIAGVTVVLGCALLLPIVERERRTLAGAGRPVENDGVLVATSGTSIDDMVVRRLADEGRR